MPLWPKSPTGSSELDESSRNEPDPDATAVYSDALNRTSEIRKALHEANLI